MLRKLGMSRARRIAASSIVLGIGLIAADWRTA